MIPYGHQQGLGRGGTEDRVAEQMMGLSYLPYTSPCLSRTPGNLNQQQNHSSAPQVTPPPTPPTRCPLQVSVR